MKRFIVFCILISPVIFFLSDFKNFLGQINPMTNWENLTHFLKIYLFPASFLALFVFYSKKQKLLTNSLLLVFLCLVSLFLLNISNQAILSFSKDYTLCFSLFAYSVSLFFFFYVCLYSLFTREKYLNLTLTFLLYHWLFFYMTELMFNFEVNGFIASGSLMLANTILFVSVILINTVVISPKKW